MRRILAAALLVVIPLASAQDATPRAPEYNVVSFQARASREVANDQLVAVLAVEMQGVDPAALGEAVNRRMSEALKVAAAFPTVKLRSGSYQTFPRYRENQRIDSWQVSQELRLESADFAAATKLIGKLQGSMVVRSMSVRLSSQARRAAEDELIAEALAAFRERADLVREAMKAQGYRIRSIDIGSEGQPPPQPMFAMRAEAARAPVAVEAGVSQVTMTASGRIELH
jgi:predicted secreted protein